MIFECWNIDRSPLHCCGIVTSRKHPLRRDFWSIVMRKFPSRSRSFSHRRQIDYHSLIIENHSRRFHWLACKKIIIKVVSWYVNAKKIFAKIAHVHFCEKHAYSLIQNTTYMNECEKYVFELSLFCTSIARIYNVLHYNPNTATHKKLCAYFIRYIVAPRDILYIRFVICGPFY